MRFIIFLLLTLHFQSAQSQLISLFSKERTRDEKGVSFFHQYNFKLKLDSNQYYILSKSDSVLFKPPARSFYEIFNDTYLISTLIDTQIIKRGESNAYCSFPRRQSFVIPINNNENFETIYVVDFQEKIIMEDFKFEIPTKQGYYSIQKIDLDKMEIIICNKNGKKEKLALKAIKNHFLSS